MGKRHRPREIYDLTRLRHSTMVSSPSSSVRRTRQALADRLREIRVDAGLSATALALRLGWRGHTKVSKIEHGARPPSKRDIETWCAACGAADRIPALLSLLLNVQGAYLEWSRLHRGGLERLQESSLPLHERTRRFRSYEAAVVPGHLQTPAYTEAGLRMIAEFRGTPTGDLTEAVAARMRKQLLLDTPRTFAFLIEESALRAGLGGSAVMAEQLGRLLEAARRPNVSLGIIPMDLPDRVMWPVEGFLMFDDAQVTVETATALVTVTEPAEIAVYARTFSALARMAVLGDRAGELIQRLLRL